MTENEDRASHVQPGELFFRTSFGRAFQTHALIMASAAFEIWQWSSSGGVNLVFPLVLLAAGYASSRSSYVAVGPGGLRIRSQFSIDRHAKQFAWAEITDTVITKNWGDGNTLEVRAGERFGWIHYEMLADCQGFRSAVARFAGESSPVYRCIQELEAKRGAG